MTGNNVRGVDHVGITVPDVEAATRFFESALGAEIVYDVVGDFTVVSAPGAQSDSGISFELDATIGVPPETQLRSLRLLRIGNGASIELFEYRAVPQRECAAPNDFGLQHVAFYVDDIEAVAHAVAAAGGQLLDGPHLMPGMDGGEGCRFHYARAPWGTVIELITYPNPQAYTVTTSRRRWTPQR